MRTGDIIDNKVHIFHEMIGGRSSPEVAYMNDKIIDILLRGHMEDGLDLYVSQFPTITIIIYYMYVSIYTLCIGELNKMHCTCIIVLYCIDHN